MEPLVKFIRFMYVFAVGKKQADSMNFIEGAKEQPKTGSSSLAVAKHNMCPNVVFPLRPPATIAYYMLLNHIVVCISRML